uniref:Uncharacterized protein n=1 Tax=Anguilla anguilla TaxID=7936 RepID=A0A0E9TRE7_ANGAN
MLPFLKVFRQEFQPVDMVWLQRCTVTGDISTRAEHPL